MASSSKTKWWPSASATPSKPSKLTVSESDSKSGTPLDSKNFEPSPGATIAKVMASLSPLVLVLWILFTMWVILGLHRNVDRGPAWVCAGENSHHFGRNQKGSAHRTISDDLRSDLVREEQRLVLRLVQCEDGGIDWGGVWWAVTTDKGTSGAETGRSSYLARIK